MATTHRPQDQDAYKHLQSIFNPTGKPFGDTDTNNND